MPPFVPADQRERLAEREFYPFDDWRPDFRPAEIHPVGFPNQIAHLLLQRKEVADNTVRRIGPRSHRFGRAEFGTRRRLGKSNDKIAYGTVTVRSVSNQSFFACISNAGVDARRNQGPGSVEVADILHNRPLARGRQPTELLIGKTGDQLARICFHAVDLGEVLRQLRDERLYCGG